MRPIIGLWRLWVRHQNLIVVFAALGGLVSMGIGLAAAFWFLHRSVVESKSAGKAAAAEAAQASAESPA